MIPRSLVVRDLLPVEGRQVLLTFDDGPHPEVTPALLDRLDAYDARGVFFVVGKRVAAAPGVLRRVSERGHHIGNHSYQHRNDGDPWFVNYLRDLRRCQAIVEAHTGIAPRLFRPPKGHLSLTSLTVPRLLGLTVMNWSLNVRDWACRSASDALAAAREFDRLVAPGQIVLLHDDNPYVLDVLDHVLPRLRDRGFDLRTAARRL